MMEKMNHAGVTKSFFLGIVIGLILQFLVDGGLTLQFRVILLLCSGSMGFIIGFITEWLTALLPIRLARTRTYFVVNNLIAMAITAAIMVISLFITSSVFTQNADFLSILLTVLVIVSISNLLDYLLYKRSQAKLRQFKESMLKK